MTVYVVHGCEEHDSDTGHDVKYKSHVYGVFSEKIYAKRYRDENGGKVTEMVVDGC